MLLGFGKNLSWENSLTGILCAGALSLVLSGCQGQAQGGNQTQSGHAGSQEYEHELAVLPLLSAGEIAKIQRQLAGLGYDPGPIDGVVGKQTAIAIKHFQVDLEVQVDGKLTPALIHELKERYARSKARQGFDSQKIGESSGEAGKASEFLDSMGPTYEVADAYVYTDGRVETVTRVGPERTLWETADGSIYTAYRNFILPPISWKSGASVGENMLQPATGEKWPPAVSGDVVFSVGSKAGGDTLDMPKTWSGKWRCVAKGVSPVNATVGRFDSIVIECLRAKPEPGTWKKRTWYYVREIGHYVRRVDLIHGTGREVTVDLVAVRPGGKGWPPAASGGLDWSIQEALDAGDFDNTIEWRSSAVGATFNIRLGKGDVAAPGKAFCRRYSLERTGLEQARLFPAIACKMPGGERWLTPGLDPGSVIPVARGR